MIGEKVSHRLAQRPGSYIILKYVRPVIKLRATRALAYIRERRVGLSVYLDDPEVSIDTNHLERALRVIPMGRKNWLFSWTELGAKHVGIVQSLLATCRLHDINPYDYFVASLVHQLTPRIWKQMFAANPLRSDLYDLAGRCTLANG